MSCRNAPKNKKNDVSEQLSSIQDAISSHSASIEELKSVSSKVDELLSLFRAKEVSDDNRERNEEQEVDDPIDTLLNGNKNGTLYQNQNV